MEVKFTLIFMMIVWKFILQVACQMALTSKKEIP